MASDGFPLITLSLGLSYLNEGAANIVYKISNRHLTPEPSLIEEFGEGTPPPSEIESDIGQDEDKVRKYLHTFDNKLLRVRKDLPTTRPVALNHEAWEQIIAPLFNSNQIVNQSLVRLPAHIIDNLNNELRQMEQDSAEGGIAQKIIRPAKRHGIYLVDDEFGLLVEDMTPGPSGDLVIEFKPKWLAQSPSAPEKAVRCRQCARVARANADLSRQRQPPQISFCPLDLFTDEGLFLVSEIIFPRNGDDAHVPGEFECPSYRFNSWIAENNLLEHLRDLQQRLDPIGVLENDKDDESFRAAMTLRDCSVFVRVPANGDKAEARIGDLDLKSASKAEYWKETERALIDEGWYTGTEIDQQPNVCQLSPARKEDDNLSF